MLRLSHYTPHSQVSCFERIWETDSLLDASNITSVIHELSGLRDRAVSHKRSADGITTALVDPLLYPLVYGRSLVSYQHRLPRQVPAPTSDMYTVCSEFALLPSDVEVSPSGSIRFLSYINDIHPQQQPRLYKALETTLAAFIPLFEHSLTDLHRNNPLAQRIPGPCRYTVWDEPDPPEYSDDEDGWMTYERDMRHWILNRPIQLPDVPDTGYIGGLEHRNHLVSLRGRNLQIIVNITETRLVSVLLVSHEEDERIIYISFQSNLVDQLFEGLPGMLRACATNELSPVGCIA